jgi:hypothetical protein
MAQYWLTLLLRINAVLLMLALPAVVIPFPWMQSIHQALGMGELEHSPIIEYLARSLSLIYAMLGLVTWVIAGDLERYGPIVRMWGLAAIVCGAVLFAVDLVIEMPIFWLLAEGPYLIPLGLVIVWLHQKTDRNEAALNGGPGPDGNRS